MKGCNIFVLGLSYPLWRTEQYKETQERSIIKLLSLKRKSSYFKEKASAEETFMWVLECEESHQGNYTSDRAAKESRSQGDTVMHESP